MSCLTNVTTNIKAGAAKIAKVSNVLALTVSIVMSGAASAAPISISYVGTWDSTSGANTTGISAGQKYVVRVGYDDSSAVTNNVDVLDGAFGPTGNVMSTVALNLPGNSIDVFVPMAAYDAGSPFVYTQNTANHFFFGPNSPVPTLNFVNNSSISDQSNIIGVEFEGDFAGAGNHFIELFNTATPGNPTQMVAQVVDINTGVASTDTNGLAAAVDLVVDAGPDIVYNAASLIQTANASITQSNNLGAGRLDGEDFVDLTWTPNGTVTGNSNQVGIADSGLTMTTSTTTWSVSAEEQMTGLVDADTTNVSYDNAIPTLNATGVANASGVDFTFASGDADLAVNALISGFEMLTPTAIVDGLVDATAFFADLFTLGSDFISNADLLAEFGAGIHEVLFTITDKAGALSTSSVNFTVTGSVNPPNQASGPSTILLLLGGLVLLSRKQLVRSINKQKVKHV